MLLLDVDVERLSIKFHVELELNIGPCSPSSQLRQAAARTLAGVGSSRTKMTSTNRIAPKLPRRYVASSSHMLKKDRYALGPGVE
jgi:hypothetical protein